MTCATHLHQELSACDRPHVNGAVCAGGVDGADAAREDDFVDGGVVSLEPDVISACGNAATKGTAVHV